MTDKLNSEDIKVLHIMRDMYKKKLESEHWQVIGYMSVNAVNHFVSESRKIEESLNTLFKRVDQLFYSQYEKEVSVPSFSAEDRLLLIHVFSYYHDYLNSLRSNIMASVTIKVETKNLHAVISEVDKDLRAASEAFARFTNISFPD